MKKVIEAYKAIENFKLLIKKVNQEIEDNRAIITERFIPRLMEAYDDWEPKIGEPMIIVDFLENVCFQVTLESLEGTRGRAKESAQCFHRFDLEPNLGEYNTATFVIPMFFYEEIKNDFNLKRWDD